MSLLQFFLSERLLHYFDGAAVNVDSLTQFALGVDKQNEAQQHAFWPTERSGDYVNL